MTQDDVPPRFAVDFAGATLLGIYRVTEKLADGGMGSVWLGEDTNLGRKIVVKVPHVRFLGEPGFRARFEREITELVRLEHPNIVRILAQGTHEQIPFFVLQYLGGGSLESRRGASGADAVVPWLRTIAATLDFVHGRGVVHRDVKPENILFDEEGHVFLSDFGVVKALDEDLDITDVGTGVGSPNYMAPEQGLGQPVEGAADQYGLATAVYESIAGRLPFEGTSALEVLLNKQRHPPTALSEYAPGLPAACADAVMRGLAPDPAERFATCQEFADAFLAGAGIFDRTPPAGVPAVGRSRNGRIAALTIALLAVVALAVGYAAGWFSPGPPPEQSKAAFGVTLLAPGAEPRRVLRYRPVPGSVEMIVIDITTTESKKIDERDPIETSHPRLLLGLRLEVADVTPNGDTCFVWECAELSLEAAEGTHPAIWKALRSVAKRIQGTSGSGRQSARGIHVELSHDTPLPNEPELQSLIASITEILEQLSTPIPEEPVGVGARWEVSYARNREGIRLTQTVTFELESLDENEARLRIYVAVAGLHQPIEHFEVPAKAIARLKSGHGDGEGEIVIDLDRLGDRSVRMIVGSRMAFSLMVGDEEKELLVSRRLRYQSERE
jgi:hypothetical protein